MKIAAIIAEYNPFHNGHKYQIEQTRANGATHIAAVMSSNVVQRGDIAIVDKQKRAELAVRNGVDLVLELHAVFSAAAGEYFAEGAVQIIAGLNCVDMLSFGAECGDIQLLKKAADFCEQCKYSEDIKKLVSQGYTFPRAMSVLCNDGSIKEVLNGANNTLAIEYINALKKFEPDIKPMVVKRTGSMHDSSDTQGNFASASLIRNKIFLGEDINGFVPENICETYADIEKVYNCILWTLNLLGVDDISKAPDANIQIARKIKSTAAAMPESFKAFLEQVKSKNITMARIRRVIIQSVLGIRKRDIFNGVPYCRVLAFNDKGVEIMRKSGGAVGTRLIKLAESKQGKRFAQIEQRATNLQYLAFNKHDFDCINEYTRKITKT